MKESTLIKKTVEDTLIADQCNNCCLCCKKYKTVKEQKANCQALKARIRLINREARQVMKDKNKQ